MITAKKIRLANLKKLILEKRTIRGIAEAAGTSPAYLSQVLNEAKSGSGTARGIGDVLARKIEAGCGKPVGWMDSRHDEPDGIPVAKRLDGPEFNGPDYGLPPGNFMRIETIEEGDPRYITIPKVRLRLTAGISGFEVEPYLEDESTLPVPLKWVRARSLNPAYLIAIDVRGESMEPTFYAGDTVVLNTADKEPVDGAVFAINYEGEPVVKRMMRDAGEWWLTSDNADQRRFPRKICEGDRCIIIGRVVRRETERF